MFVKMVLFTSFRFTLKSNWRSMMASVHWYKPIWMLSQKFWSEPPKSNHFLRWYNRPFTKKHFRDLCTVGISTQNISGFAIGCSSNWATENSCQWGNMPGPRGTGALNTVWTNNSESVVCGDRMMWFSKWHRHTQKKELRVLPTGVEATTFTLARQMLYHWDIGNSWYARSLNSPNNIQEICHHGSSLTA